MNRRQAARFLKTEGHLRFDNGDGRHTVYFHIPEWQREDEELDSQLFSYTAPGATIDAVPISPQFWKPVSGKDILQLIRSAYPRFTGRRCQHVHQSGARCIWDVGDHNHCKKCGEAHVHHHLCFTCQTDADKVRLDLTRQMAAYYNTFGIPFQKDEDTYDHMTGQYDEYDEPMRYRGDMEDFHSDG